MDFDGKVLVVIKGDQRFGQWVQAPGDSQLVFGLLFDTCGFFLLLDDVGHELVQEHLTKI